MAVERHRGVYIPDAPGKRHEPMVGPGVSVWAIVGYLRTHDGDFAAVQREYDPYLTLADIQAAWEYYRQHPSEIDATLVRNEQLDLAVSDYNPD